MARTRDRAKGRRGGEAERFAYLPESVLMSPALATAPHAALRILTIMVVGRPRERNGLLACSESYAEKFGVTSSDTLRRSLTELLARQLITVTRPGKKLNRNPTLYAVTWWPIAYRNGEPLAVPEEPSHAYLQWQCITPTIGVSSERDDSENGKSSLRLSGYVTPTIGVDDVRHHSDSVNGTAEHHSDGRGNSRFSGEGRWHDAGRAARASPKGSLARGERGTATATPSPSKVAAVVNLFETQPHLQDGDVARACRLDQSEVTALRARWSRHA